MKRSILAAAAAFLAVAVGCSHLTHHNTKTQTAIVPSSAPAAVTAAFVRDHPNVMIKKVVKEVYKNGTLRYEYTFVDTLGTRHRVEYSAAGKQFPEP